MYVTERLAFESAREYALRVLRANIVSLELEPGEAVTEKDLAEELGISRTPVREALLELSKAQIVEIYPQRGCCISKIDYNLVEEVRFLRTTLECAIVEIMCETATPEVCRALEKNLRLQEFYLDNEDSHMLLKVDDDFHLEMFTACKKLQIYRLMHTMTAHFDRLRNVSVKTINNRKVIDDHKEILDAIEAKNVAHAVDAMKKHLSNYKYEEDELRNKHPAYFK